MKRCLIIGMIISLRMAQAQMNVVPFIGLNSTKYSESYSGYEKGGSYAIVGVEVEKSFQRNSYSPVTLSLVTGASYLSNGLKRAVSFTALNSYSYKKTDIQTQYVQVPFLVRINWRAFPLVENWRIFFGAGVSLNSLTYARITEDAIDTGIPLSYPTIPPPSTATYHDSQNATNWGVRNSLFKRFEFGMKFKNLQVTWRLSFSTQDMYFKGYEKTWSGPVYDSFYINAHETRGITKEKYSELVFGWRF